ncbi:MAG: PQQ-dependent sugar dehydrogenase [Gemmatimonadota bacterium]
MCLLESREAGPTSNRTPMPPWSWWAFHVLFACALVVGAGELWLGSRVWALPMERGVFLLGIAAAHLGAVGWTAFSRDTDGSLGRVSRAVLRSALCFGGVAGGILLLEWPYYSGPLLVLGGVASAVVLSIPRRAIARRGAMPTAGASAIVIAFVLLGPMVSGRGSSVRDERIAAAMSELYPALDPQDDSVGVRIAATAYYPVRVTVQYALVPSRASGGGLEPVSDGLLILSGDGALLRAVEEVPGGVLRATVLPGRVPMNTEGYVAEVLMRIDLGILSSGALEEQELRNFRAMDVAAAERTESWRIYVSHHHWNEEARCFTVRVSVTELSRDLLAELEWTTLYETQPCLSLDESTNFEQAGGRMAFLSDDTLLLAVGDQRMWAVEDVQSPTSDYGKTLRIDLRTGEGGMHTSGHRNPQGLLRDALGRIWETEHGPQGGDELNLIRSGANYGWPVVSFGTAYGSYEWPGSPSPGRQAGFEDPVFAWIPSIGVSNLIRVEADRFALWKGDLLVASLWANTLYRIRLDGDAVEYVEPIPVRSRIRDLTEGPDGRIFMLLDDGGVGWLDRILPSEPDPQASGLARGEIVFERCGECHLIGSGLEHRAGPDLFGIVGRPIASAEGFEYSNALRQVSGAWTEERLSRFLRNPNEVASGTPMPSTGLTDPGDVTALIQFLREAR